MNISLAGTNLWQAGNTVDEFAITKNGSVGIDILEDNDPFAVLVEGDSKYFRLTTLTS